MWNEWKRQNQGVCYEILSPCNIKTYIHEALPTWLVKCELKDYKTNEQSKVDKEKPKMPQAYTKNYRHLRKSGIIKVVLLRDTTQFDIQYQGMKTYIQVTLNVLNWYI